MDMYSFCYATSISPQQFADCHFLWHDATDWSVHVVEILLAAEVLVQLPIILLQVRPVSCDIVQLENQDHESAFDHQLRRMHHHHGVEFDNGILGSKEMNCCN